MTFKLLTPSDQMRMYVHQQLGNPMDDGRDFRQVNPGYTGRDSLYQDQSRGGHLLDRENRTLASGLAKSLLEPDIDICGLTMSKPKPVDTDIDKYRIEPRFTFPEPVICRSVEPEIDYFASLKPEPVPCLFAEPEIDYFASLKREPVPCLHVEPEIDYFASLKREPVVDYSAESEAIQARVNRCFAALNKFCSDD